MGFLNRSGAWTRTDGKGGLPQGLTLPRQLTNDIRISNLGPAVSIPGRALRLTQDRPRRQDVIIGGEVRGQSPHHEPQRSPDDAAHNPDHVRQSPVRG